MRNLEPAYMIDLYGIRGMYVMVAAIERAQSNSNIEKVCFLRLANLGVVRLSAA